MARVSSGGDHLRELGTLTEDPISSSMIESDCGHGKTRMSWKERGGTLRAFRVIISQDLSGPTIVRVHL